MSSFDADRPPPPALSAGTVSLWVLGPRSLASFAAEGAAWLAADEVERATRFRDPADATRFVGRRAALRWLLGYYFETTPQSVTFDRSCRLCGDLAHGRPRLAVPDVSLFFGTSSCHAAAAVVLSRDVEVAVDIEPADRTIAADLLADERVYTAAEWERLVVLGDSRSQVEALQMWTAKEAVLKLSGHGVTRPPASVETSSLSTTGRCTQADGRSVDVRRFVDSEVGIVGTVAVGSLAG